MGLTVSKAAQFGLTGTYLKVMSVTIHYDRDEAWADVALYIDQEQAAASPNEWLRRENYYWDREAFAPFKEKRDAREIAYDLVKALKAPDTQDMNEDGEIIITPGALFWPDAKDV